MSLIINYHYPHLTVSAKRKRQRQNYQSCTWFIISVSTEWNKTQSDRHTCYYHARVTPYHCFNWKKQTHRSYLAVSTRWNKQTLVISQAHYIPFHCFNWKKQWLSIKHMHDHIPNITSHCEVITVEMKLVFRYVCCWSQWWSSNEKHQLTSSNEMKI